MMCGNYSSGISSLSLRYVENRFYDEYFIYHTGICQLLASTFASKLFSPWELSYIYGKPGVEKDLGLSLDHIIEGLVE